jgi:hypothetical protein
MQLYPKSSLSRFSLSLSLTLTHQSFYQSSSGLSSASLSHTSTWLDSLTLSLVRPAPPFALSWSCIVRVFVCYLLAPKFRIKSVRPFHQSITSSSFTISIAAFQNNFFQFTSKTLQFHLFTFRNISLSKFHLFSSTFEPFPLTSSRCASSP